MAELGTRRITERMNSPPRVARAVFLPDPNSHSDFDCGINLNLKVGAASSRDHAYYLGLSGTEGVEIVQILREKYFKR